MSGLGGEADVLAVWLPDAYRAALDTTEDASTIITDVVSGRPARCIKNRLIDELTDSAAEPLPFPAQWSLTFPLEASGDRDVTGLLAGQAVALTRDMPAADLVRTLAEETSQRLRAFD